VKTVVISGLAGAAGRRRPPRRAHEHAAAPRPACTRTGASHASVHTPRTVDDASALRHRVSDARTAVVVGAGPVGLTAVDALGARGLDVTLVERSEQVPPGLDPELAEVVRDALAGRGVAVRAGEVADCIEQTDDGVQVVLADGERVPADVVAVCVDEHGPGGASTSVRVAGLSVALVGSRVDELDGVPYATLRLRPRGSAGVDGAAGAHLVVHVGADGRMLGGQAVGDDGVGARLEVLADALRASADAAAVDGGGRAAPRDRPGADPGAGVPPAAATAPDAGAVMERWAGLPAGIAHVMRTSAVLDGTLRLWYPDELDAVLRESLLLDVRSAQEFASGHLEGAVHVPLGDLTERVAEVRAVAGGRPVRVHCRTGFRSYLAHRVLAEAGIDSAALSGGLTGLLAARPGTRLVGCHRRPEPDVRPG